MPPQRSTDHFELKPAQQRVLGVLKSEGASRLTRAQYEELSGVSRSQAAYDLAELVENGILERLGSGRATRYRIVHLSTPGRRGHRRWTQDRIRAALEQFCADHDAWPTASEFKQAGRFDLYVAASRYGGIRFWTSELGFTREPRQAVPVTSPRRWTFRPRLQWVPAAGVAILALALAGAGHIRLSPGGTVLQAASPRLLDATLKPTAVRQGVRHVQTARHAKPAARQGRTNPVHTSTELAVVHWHVSSSSEPAQTFAPARTTSSSPTATNSSNPAPLPAPSAVDARHALPPPPPGS